METDSQIESRLTAVGRGCLVVGRTKKKTEEKNLMDSDNVW